MGFFFAEIQQLSTQHAIFDSVGLGGICLHECVSSVYFKFLCLATAYALSNLRNSQSVDSHPIKEVHFCLSRVSLFNKTCWLELNLSCYVIMTGNLAEI